MSWKRTVLLISLFQIPSLAFALGEEWGDPSGPIDFASGDWIGHPVKHAPPHLLSAGEVGQIETVRIEREIREIGWKGVHRRFVYTLDRDDQSARKTLVVQTGNLVTSRCEFPPDRRAFSKLMAALSASTFSTRFGRNLRDERFQYRFEANKFDKNKAEPWNNLSLFFVKAGESATSDFLRFINREFQETCPLPEEGPLLKTEADFLNFKGADFSDLGKDSEVRFYIDHERKEVVWSRGKESGSSEEIMRPCRSDWKADYREVRKIFAKVRITKNPPRSLTRQTPDAILLRKEESSTEFALSSRARGRPGLTGFEKLKARAKLFKRNCPFPIEEKAAPK